MTKKDFIFFANILGVATGMEINKEVDIINGYLHSQLEGYFKSKNPRFNQETFNIAVNKASDNYINEFKSDSDYYEKRFEEEQKEENKRIKEDAIHDMKSENFI
tara:strand:+ start:166 stop:477 length:312 start_codon:yes stop_codon:yes gene_type:complete